MIKKNNVTQIKPGMYLHDNDGEWGGVILKYWDDSFSVGIKALDNQHKILFDTVAPLLESRGGAEGMITVHKTFNSLLDYADYHFKFEKELMASHHYPDAESHNKEHGDLIEELNSYYVMVEFGSLPPAQDIGRFLNEWVESHVLKADKELGNFLCQRGCS